MNFQLLSKLKMIWLSMTWTNEKVWIVFARIFIISKLIWILTIRDLIKQIFLNNQKIHMNRVKEKKNILLHIPILFVNNIKIQ